MNTFKKFTQTLPRYYLVDFEIYVKVELKGDRVVATNHLGSPYPVFKAIESGTTISKEDYQNAVLSKIRHY